jgi:acyl-coenzyme A synthetase/AMP-(fatty) acid ligase
LIAWVRQEIGPIATPDVIQFAPGLPKTRSGKIMRRILRKIAEGIRRIWAISQPSLIPAWWII